jgi:methyl acetate hydrolase
MKRVCTQWAVVLVLLAHVEARAPSIAAPGAAALSAFLQGAVARGDVPGLVAVVTGPDGVMYHQAFGKLDAARDAAMPRDAIFRIASMTKPLTSVAALMLIDEGKLKLDDRVDAYLPAFSRREVITRIDEASGTYETRPATRPITIRHLLTHTSGIGYAWSQPPIALAQKKTGLPEPELPLLHDPGARWTYGASTRVLGDIVGTVSGQRIDRFLQARILDPLGMRDTSYAVPPAKRARVATVHQRTNGTLVEQANPPALPETVRGDGGLYSTGLDYSAFLRMLLNGGRSGSTRLLSEGSMQALTRNQIGSLVVERQPVADPSRSRPYPLGAGADTWSLGFQLAAAPAGAAGRSQGSYSWAGINNTHFWVDPGRQIGVILLMQVLPFYDERALAVLQGFEALVNAHVQLR